MFELIFRAVLLAVIIICLLMLRVIAESAFDLFKGGKLYCFVKQIAKQLFR